MQITGLRCVSVEKGEGWGGSRAEPVLEEQEWKWWSPTFSSGEPHSRIEGGIQGSNCLLRVHQCDSPTWLVRFSPCPEVGCNRVGIPFGAHVALLTMVAATD